MAWGTSWGTFWADAWGDATPAPGPTQNAWGDAWGNAWGGAWGGEVVVFTPASVTVRAFREMFFGGVIRAVGVQFEITSPYEFTPYGMVLVDTPPANWNQFMEGYNEPTDNDRIRFPGRYENRIPTAGGQPAPAEAGNPYD